MQSWSILERPHKSRELSKRWKRSNLHLKTEHKMSTKPKNCPFLTLTFLFRKNIQLDFDDCNESTTDCDLSQIDKNHGWRASRAAQWVPQYVLALQITNRVVSCSTWLGQHMRGCVGVKSWHVTIVCERPLLRYLYFYIWLPFSFILNDLISSPLYIFSSI